MKTSDNSGYILITTLLLLLVLTIVGLSAIGTSTIENALSGNTRLKVRNDAVAESGINIASPLVEHLIRKEDTEGFNNIIQDTALLQELKTSNFNGDDVDGSPDVNFTVDTGPALVDIDKMDILGWAEGSALELAKGYSGPGQGAATGHVTYYRINSTGKGLVGSKADSGAVYKYVPKNK